MHTPHGVSVRTYGMSGQKQNHLNFTMYLHTYIHASFAWSTQTTCTWTPWKTVWPKLILFLYLPQSCKPRPQSHHNQRSVSMHIYLHVNLTSSDLHFATWFTAHCSSRMPHQTHYQIAKQRILFMCAIRNSQEAHDAVNSVQLFFRRFSCGYNIVR